MSSTSDTEPAWARNIRFDAFQCKLASETGDFAYFHTTRAQWTAELQVLDAVDPDVKRQLGNINERTAKSNDSAMATLKTNLENTDIDQSLPQDVQQADWAAALRDQNERAKVTVTDEMDAATEEAINLISKLPPKAQGAAANAYQVGVELVIKAFEFLVAKIKEIYNHIVDFIKRVFNSLVKAYNAVKDWVVDVVSKIKNFFGSRSRAWIDSVDDQHVSQATKLLLSLIYSFRVPNDEVVASTDRIWDRYLTRYSEATSEQGPQDVTVSRKPSPQGDRDTDGKLMFVSWQAGGDTGTGRQLIERVVLSEQKSLGGSYSGGLRYNIVDMEDPSKVTQQKRGVESKQEIELRSRRHQVQY